MVPAMGDTQLVPAVSVRPKGSVVSRRVVRSLLAAAALLGGAGCAAGVDEAKVAQEPTTVQPRVILDGLVELSRNTDGRVFVDEVVFHAPDVVLKDGDKVLVDELAVDRADGPLFFRYDVAALEGAALGDERRWLLPSDGALAPSLFFGFEPLSASREELRELGAAVGYRLDALRGHTAYVHGYVAVDTDGSTLTGAASGGDPDGSPAEPTGTDESGDPDGSPADGSPDSQGGEDEGGDPDGSPADGAAQSQGGDPDGSPADTGGDPDGSPADSDDDSVAQGAMEQSGAFRRPSTYRQATSRLVPFYVVVNDAFTLRVSMSDLPKVADGAVLPIDLHLQADRLFAGDRLATLDRRAAAGTITAPVVLELGADDASSVFTVKNGKAKVAAATDDEPGLSIESDPRGQ